jgi:hypothetical protein
MARIIIIIHVLSCGTLAFALCAASSFVRLAIGSRMMRALWIYDIADACALSPGHQICALSADHYVIAPDDFFISRSPQIVINFYRSKYKRIYFDLENRECMAKMTQFSPILNKIFKKHNGLYKLMDPYLASNRSRPTWLYICII